jgi:hypothetical protein
LERLALIARLKPDGYERAEELASDVRSEGVAPAPIGGSVFLSQREVVFMIEGDDAELRARNWFDDPVLSAAIGSWLPLFDGPLHVAREVASWDLGSCLTLVPTSV